MTWTIHQGDALAVLRTLGDESVHTCVTSPPYWGLRHYGAGVWVGGDSGCSHSPRVDPHIESSTLAGGKGQVGHQRETTGSACPHCGAVYASQEMGSEPTLEAYISGMVSVFEEVRRVLRSDGVLFLNMGDSYAGSGKGQLSDGTPTAKTGEKQRTSKGTRAGGLLAPAPVGLKPLDLCGVPWRLAMALQAAGWYLRIDVVLVKPAPMPESVRGWTWERHMMKVLGNLRGAGTGKMDSPEATRLTQGFNARWDAAHDDRPNSDRAGKEGLPSAQYEPCPGCKTCEPNMVDCEDCMAIPIAPKSALLVNCKKCGGRGKYGLVLRRGAWRPTRAHEYVFMLTKSAEYWCNQEAVKELADYGPRNRLGRKYGPDQNDPKIAHHGHQNGGNSRNPRSWWLISPEPMGEIAAYSDVPRCPVHRQRPARTDLPCTCHYAAFPPALVERCLKASCPERACAACGAPWAPVVERTKVGSYHNHKADGLMYGLRQDGGPKPDYEIPKLLGLRPTCAHDAAWVPGLALDPFSGTGTTGLVAGRLGMRYVGIELRAEYVELSRARIIADAPLLMTTTERR